MKTGKWGADNRIEVNVETVLTEFLLKVHEGKFLVVADVFEEVNLEIIKILVLVCRNEGAPSLIRRHCGLRIWFYHSSDTEQ
jgi:hypothetical protein